MAATDDHLAWALKALRENERLGGYQAARRYYEGDHPMMFATDKFRSVFGKNLATVADNLCPAVVDSVADRLKITGVNPGEGADEALAEQAWSIWQRNRMDVRAPETHGEALLTGDGYALVWLEAGEPVIWSIPASDMAVTYDPNRPGVLRRAARMWQDPDDGRVHIDVYLEDRVERHVTRRPARSQTLAGSARAGDFLPYVHEGEAVTTGIEPHSWGRVPVVHFPNRRYHDYGISELANVVPLQDALNKAVADMLVAMEFSAFRQRWATGFDPLDPDSEAAAPEKAIEYGADHLLISTDPQTQFGTFEASALEGYVQVQENLRSEIARVSGTPLHYLFITRGDFPSGEAMKSAEARFTRKVQQRQVSFGNQWEDLLALALRMDGVDGVTGDMLSLEWESAEPWTADEVPQPAAGPKPEVAEAA